MREIRWIKIARKNIILGAHKSWIESIRDKGKAIEGIKSLTAH